MFCSRFGERERAAGKIESCEAAPAGKLCPSRLPMQAPGDHQMQNEPEIAFYADGDALADAAKFADDFAFDIADGRLCSSKQKRARQAHAFERLADDSRFQRGEVRRDVWKLRHGYELAGCGRVFATSRWRSCVMRKGGGRRRGRG